MAGWFFGGLAVFGAIVLVAASPEARPQWKMVAGCAALAALSFAGALFSAKAYERERKLARSAEGKRSESSIPRRQD